MTLGTPEPSDEVLLSEFGQGRVEAFEAFARRHQDAIFRLALRFLGSPPDRELAREVTQEVFVRAWQTLGAWRSGKGKPFTWLYRATLLVSREMLRKRPKGAVPYVEELDDRPYPGGDGLEQKQERERIMAVIMSLPPRQREIVLLYIYEDLSLNEVGQVLGIPLGTVKSNYHKALGNLRARMDEDRDKGVGHD